MNGGVIIITYKELLSNDYFKDIDVIYGNKYINNKVKHIEIYKNLLSKNINNVGNLLILVTLDVFEDENIINIVKNLKKRGIDISGIGIYDKLSLGDSLKIKSLKEMLVELPILYIPSFYQINDIVEKFEELRYYVYIHENISIDSELEISKNGIINRNLLEISNMLANTLDNNVEIIDVLNKRSYYSNRKVMKHSAEHIKSIISPRKFDKKVSIINVAEMIRYIVGDISWIVMPISYNKNSVFYLIIWEENKQIESKEYKYIYISYMLIYIMYGERYIDYKYKRKIEDNLIKHLIYDLEISRDEFYFNLKKLDKVINRNWIPICLVDKYYGNDMNYIKREIIYAANKVFGEGNILLSLLANNTFLIILNYDDNQITKDSLNKDLNKFLSKVTLSRVKSDFKIGVGTSTTDINQINDRYKKALKAIHVGEHIAKQSKIRFYTDLGILRTINLKELVEYITDESNKYDSLGNDNYIEMIDIFIESDGSYEKASKRLMLHENTLRYRMNKIEKELGINLNSYKDIVTLSILTKFKDYL